jgi:HlyD family secretion protein
MAKKQSIPWGKISLFIILIGGGFGGWNYWKANGKQSAIEYRTMTISRGDMVQSVTANGQITPVKNVQVGSQISGNIQQIFADFNTTVTSNQIIAQIDPSTYEHNVKMSEAELMSTRAALELAELNHKRTKELRANELVSQSELDKAIVDLHQAQATVSMREASLNKAKVDLSRTTIYAPVDGVVITRNIDVGQTVAASFSAPTLFIIANDLRKMQIEAMISEADVGGIENGQEVKFTVDAFPMRQFDGIVKQVRFAATTNQNVITYTTVIEVNNEDLKLRPGMTANVSVITSQKKNVIKIRNDALRFHPPETAKIKADTNALAAASGAGAGKSANQTTKARSGKADSGGAGMPSREEMKRRFESMTPEQREQFRAMRASRGGEGGMGFGGGGMGAQSQESSANKTVYLIDADNGSPKPNAELKQVTIKTGITDGSFTEVLEGLKEGDVVVCGSNAPSTAMASTQGSQARSPFGGPFGGMRPR